MRNGGSARVRGRRVETERSEVSSFRDTHLFWAMSFFFASIFWRYSSAGMLGPKPPMALTLVETTLRPATGATMGRTATEATKDRGPCWKRAQREVRRSETPRGENPVRRVDVSSAGLRKGWPWTLQPSREPCARGSRRPRHARVAHRLDSPVVP